MKKMTKIKSTKVAEKEEKPEENQEEEEEEEGQVASSEFNYLLQMPLWNLTYEKVETMKNELASKEEELEILQNTKIETMWITDLDEFLNTLKQVNMEEEEDRMNGGKKGNRRKKIVSAKKTAKEELFGESDEEFEVKKPAKKKEAAKEPKENKDPKEPKEKKVREVKSKTEASTSSTTRDMLSEASKSNNLTDKDKKLNSQMSVPAVNNSILKYLKSTSSISEGDNSLSQRIKMRENKGRFSKILLTF